MILRTDLRLVNRYIILLTLFSIYFRNTIAYQDHGRSSNNVMQIKNVSLDIDDASTLNLSVFDSEPVPESKQLNLTNLVPRLPCACAKGQCGCCTGAILQTFNQKACMNITYEPDDFAFTAALSLNGRVLYKNSISGKNPPPICVRVPQFPLLKLCARFSNVYFTGPNMHTCLNMGASLEDYQLINFDFDCFRVGANGVAIVPPEAGGGISTAIDEDDDNVDEDYDDSAR